MPVEEFRALPTVHALQFGADVSGDPKRNRSTPEGRPETHIHSNNTNPQGYYISVAKR